MGKKYAKITLFLCFFVFIGALKAQVNNDFSAFWGLEIGSNGRTTASGESIATDEEGFLYAVGYLPITSYLDYFPAGNKMFASSSSAYLIKYKTEKNSEYGGKPDGKAVWWKKISSDENKSVTKGRIVVVDNAARSVYVIGTYGNKQTYAEGGENAKIDLVSPKGVSDDLFIASYTLDGEFKAMKGFGGNGIEVPTAATLSYENGIPKLFVAGYFSMVGSETEFGGKLHKGDEDGFVFKLDANSLNVDWTSTLGGEDEGDGEYFYDIANDKSGDVYVVGSTNSRDPLKYIVDGSEQTFTPQGKFNDAYILKFKKEDGAIEWMKGVSGEGNKLINTIVFDENDDFFLTGTLEANALEFKPGNPIAVKGLFLSKHKKDASCIWVKTFGDSSDENTGNAIALGRGNKLYLGGEFYKKLEADGLTLEKPNSGEEWTSHIFVAEIDGNDGVLKQATYLDGSAMTARANALATFGDKLYLTGFVNNGMVGKDTLTIADRKIGFDLRTQKAIVVAFNAPTVETVTVTFDADNGTATVVQKIKKGEVAVAPPVPPVKAEDATNTYVFKQWELTAGTEYVFATPVIDNITLKAVYTPTAKTPVTALNAATAEGVNVTAGPNPFSNSITVSAKGEFKVRLCNLLGQELMPTSVANGTTVLQVPNLTAGVYLLNVETAKGMTSIRLIKK